MGQVAEVTDQMRTLIARAAIYRAGGLSWAEVAEQLGRSEGRVKKYPSEYRELWAEESERAHTAVVDEAVAKSLRVLHQLLETGSDRVKARVALGIWMNAIRERPQRHEVTGAEGGPVELVVTFPHRAAEVAEEDPNGDG